MTPVRHLMPLLVAWLVLHGGSCTMALGFSSIDGTFVREHPLADRAATGEELLWILKDETLTDEVAIEMQ